MTAPLFIDYERNEIPEIRFNKSADALRYLDIFKKVQEKSFIQVTECPAEDEGMVDDLPSNSPLVQEQENSQKTVSFALACLLGFSTAEAAYNSAAYPVFAFDGKFLAARHGQGMDILCEIFIFFSVVVTLNTIAKTYQQLKREKLLAWSLKNNDQKIDNSLKSFDWDLVTQAIKIHWKEVALGLAMVGACVLYMTSPLGPLIGGAIFTSAAIFSAHKAYQTQKKTSIQIKKIEDLEIEDSKKEMKVSFKTFVDSLYNQKESTEDRQMALLRIAEKLSLQELEEEKSFEEWKDYSIRSLNAAHKLEKGQLGLSLLSTLASFCSMGVYPVFGMVSATLARAFLTPKIASLVSNSAFSFAKICLGFCERAKKSLPKEALVLAANKVESTPQQPSSTHLSSSTPDFCQII